LLEGLKGYDDDDSFCFGCEGVDRWEVPDRLFKTRKVCWFSNPGYSWTLLA